MKFTPTNSSFKFEPITTPNKNIHSYFMKSETSFYIPEPLKFQSNETPIQILISDGFFVISNLKIEQDIILNSKMNLEKYKTIQKCSDEIYKIIKNTLNGVLNKNLIKTTPIQLIISDFLGRSDIIILIDIILNQLGFYAITILPFSLCLSLSFNQSMCCFIYNGGFSFIDDFCLIDTNEISNNDEDSKSYKKIRIDDEDFAEEYSRLDYIKQLLEIDGKRFSCDECSQKEDSEEKIKSHIKKEHSNNENTFFEYVKKDSFIEDIKNKMRYIFNKEKYEKVSKKIYGVEINELDGLECIVVENPIDAAISGAVTFSNLEISKETWMTGYEWGILRLRILKEKVLFYI